MNDKSFKYMRNLLKDKYAMYYDFLSKNLLGSRILSDIEKKYGVERICNGEANGELIELINSYIKENYMEDLSDINNLKSHIRKVVTYKPSILTYKKQSRMLDYIIDEIALELANEKVLDPSIDEKITKIFNQYTSVLRNELNDYIDELFEHSFLKKNNNRINYDYLKKKLCLKLLNEKNLELIINGKCDSFIAERYNDVLLDAKNKVKKYIQKHIRDLEFPFYISESLIIADMNKKIFDLGEVTLESLFNGELNSYIVEQGTKLRYEKNRVDVLNYIYNLISNSNSNCSKDELVEFSNEILTVLVEQKGYTLFSIIGGNNNQLILAIFNRLVMKKNSVIDGKNKKIKHKTIKNKVNALFRWLIIITLIASISYASISFANLVDYHIASSKMSDFDGYRYTEIYAIDNDRVAPTGENAYNFYKKVVASGYDENLYGYLAFYEAYNSVRQDRLYIMDKIMREAQWAAYDNEDISSVYFYEELYSCSCFLEFAMKRLEGMGCTEITEAKYKKALNAYVEARRTHKGEKPMDNISSDQINVIEDIMEMYSEYTKESINKFGDILTNSAYMENLEEENNRSRRNV